MVMDRYDMLQDEGIRQFILVSESLYPADAASFTIADQRTFYDRLCRHFRQPRPMRIDVRDLFANGPDASVPVRLYRPMVVDSLPALLYLHGGGYILGGLDSHDDICAEIADRAGVAVMAVAYRLAPEHPFPAALEDCRAARDWLARNGQEHGIRSEAIVLAGDSAGGSLAAALALDARDRGAPRIAGQILIYPDLGGDTSKGSYAVHAQAPGLTTDDVRHYRSVYLGSPSDLAQASKLAQPLRETNFGGLAPAFLVAAEWDPLRDDCFEYAGRLRASVVPVILRHEPLLVHAFLRARAMSKPAAESFAAVIAAVQSLAFKGQLPPQA